MMELHDLIRTRRTVHRFTDTPVAPELLIDLLETAVWVPNHKLTEPWRFILVEREAMPRMIEAAVSAISARGENVERTQKIIEKTTRKLSQTPAVVLFVMREHPDPITRQEDYASISCLIHNFSLLAWERGLGTVWETYGFIRQPEFKHLVGLAEDEIIVGSVHVGEPKIVPAPKERTPASSRISRL